MQTHFSSIMSFFSSKISLLHLFVHHGDDPSWIQYQALWLLRMKFQEQTFYCSYLLQIHHISSRTCSTIWDWVWLLTQSIQEKQWWGLGARRLAPHTHTCITNWIAKWESEVWPPAEIAIQYTWSNSIVRIDIKWSTFLQICHSILPKNPNLFQWEVPPADVLNGKRSGRPEPLQPGME